MRKINKNLADNLIQGKVSIDQDCFWEDLNDIGKFRFGVILDGQFYVSTKFNTDRFGENCICTHCEEMFIEGTDDYIVTEKDNPLANQWHIRCVKNINDIQ